MQGGLRRPHSRCHVQAPVCGRLACSWRSSLPCCLVLHPTKCVLWWLRGTCSLHSSHLMLLVMLLRLWPCCYLARLYHLRGAEWHSSHFCCSACSCKRRCMPCFSVSCCRGCCCCWVSHMVACAHASSAASRCRSGAGALVPPAKPAIHVASKLVERAQQHICHVCCILIGISAFPCYAVKPIQCLICQHSCLWQCPLQLLQPGSEY